MTDRYNLIGYIATLMTLMLVFAAALIAAYFSPPIIDKMEVFGLGTITGGLIGVLRMPQRGASEATVASALNKLPDALPAPDTPVVQPVVIQQPADNPVPVANQGDPA